MVPFEKHQGWRSRWGKLTLIRKFDANCIRFSKRSQHTAGPRHALDQARGRFCRKAHGTSVWRCCVLHAHPPRHPAHSWHSVHADWVDREWVQPFLIVVCMNEGWNVIRSRGRSCDQDPHISTSLTQILEPIPWLFFFFFRRPIRGLERKANRSITYKFNFPTFYMGIWYISKLLIQGKSEPKD